MYHLSDDAIDCLADARSLVDDEKDKLDNPYGGSSFILSTAIHYLNKSEAAGKSMEYHAIKADILDIAWRKRFLREDICDALSPDTRDDPDMINRLADACADNAAQTLTVFIANKALKTQIILNRKYQAYTASMQRA